MSSEPLIALADAPRRLANRYATPALTSVSAGDGPAEVAADCSTRPVLLVLHDARAGAIAAALERELAAAPGSRPRALVRLDGAQGQEQAWQEITKGMDECLRRLPLLPARRIGMCWEVWLATDHRLRAADIRPLLQDWTARSDWPLLVTLLVDVAALCRPWQAAQRPASELGWEEVCREVAALTSWEGEKICWNGAYHLGVGNRFGFTVDTTIPQTARLLALAATSDLAGWLRRLPACAEENEQNLSAIGCSALWEPAAPWQSQIELFQARRLARAYQEPQRLGALHGVDRYLAAQLQHPSRSQELSGVAAGRAVLYAAAGDRGLAAECRLLAEKVVQRQERFLAPLRQEMEKRVRALGRSLEEELRGRTQELTLNGGLHACADLLASSAARLEALEHDAGQDEVDAQERSRTAGYALSQLLTSGAGLLGPTLGSWLLPWRWWLSWRRWLWLRRTRRALLRVLEWESRQELDAVLRTAAQDSLGQVRRLQQQAQRLREQFAAAEQQLAEQAGKSLQPALPTDMPGLLPDLFDRWVADQLGSTVGQLPGSLADVRLGDETKALPWTEWDRERIERVLRTVAGRQAEQRGDSPIPPEMRRHDEAANHRAELLSHPLVPVPAWSYDAAQNQVFQCWLVPDHSESAHFQHRAMLATDLPFPVAVAVYKDFPLAAVAGEGE